ncbi:hypothetical protein GWI33_014349 [Rhynchophorus ferrugineus]|uniref:Uncharacterized protein n=1 Tax=Rhynchophorus ferrugineus TaxID=354439 RepID=A0A834I6B0_RHYFE|nr:hypothetical protein GWI33_014349 [Rhynchophorus ferrugineus]
MAPCQNGIKSAQEEVADDIKLGKILANPEPGEEIVISGLAGQYPDSRNVYHFRDNLFNKIDMVSEDNRRWEPGHPEIPHRTGKLYDVEKFDAAYFGVHFRQSHQMDPMCRLILEVAMEAVLDAGIHPADLEGTNTGVFIGVCFSESMKSWFYDKLTCDTYAITGCDRNMIPNRVSYFLKLKGPSITCDTACSSSLYSLEHAYRAIRSGECDRAIVGGVNLCLSPMVSLQFARLGVLSIDGSCKAFDNSGNGYARSETVSVVILQKYSEAKRIYATLLHAKTNCDGYKDSGITYPSGDMQIKLLKEFYEECSVVKPNELSFLEAHGTGTKVGDPEELQAIEEIFLKGRKTPLLIGSVKSNIGHTEPSAGLCSATKAIIAMETGYIPPNLHYTVPREGIKSLENGRIKVVTEKQPFEDNRGLIGINSFGFGGGNCHVLLKHNPTQKSIKKRPKDDLPRLVCVSGRTLDSTTSLLDSIIENKVDVEYIRLLQDIFRKTIENQPYRGFILAQKDKEIFRSAAYFNSRIPDLFLCFGCIDEKSRLKAKEFLEIPQFSKTVERVHDILSTKGISIMNILTSTTAKTVLELVLADMTLQLGIVDILRDLQIKSTKSFGVNKGFSLGYMICCYYDGALSLKEVVEIVFIIGSIANNNTKNGHGELIDLIDDDNKSEIETRLRKILPEARKLSGVVITDDNCNEVSPSTLVKLLGSFTVVDYVSKLLKKELAIFEIGNGDVGMVLHKYRKNMPILNTLAGLESFLLSVGRLYELGFNPQLHNIYPAVQYPVSRGTPMISPYLKWNHNNDWFVSLYNKNDMEFEQRSFKICLKIPEFSSVVGHIIDGRNLFPATGYLYLVWKSLSDIHRLIPVDMRVIFENCRFIRACSMPSNPDMEIDLGVTIQSTSGRFEVTESGQTVVTGTVRYVKDNETDPVSLPIPVEDNKPKMTTKDVYKELRLRGYNYKGKFKAIQTCDVSCELASIKWEDDWVAFMDNMLQVKILQEDTRMLYVPTTIHRLAIDAKKHLDICSKLGENPNIPVYSYRHAGIIQSGGIEIRGMIASSIPRRKYLATPVLEKYVFVPNTAMMNLEQALRVHMQILLENTHVIHVKAVELIDEATPDEPIVLGDTIYDVLADQPLIQPAITVLSKTDLEVTNVTVEDKKLLTEVDCHLVIASKLLERPNILTIALGSIQDSGFILSRESLEFDLNSYQNPNISIVSVFTIEKEKMVLVKKMLQYKSPVTVKVSSADESFEWLSKLKTAMEKDENILVYAEEEQTNGVMGFINCIRREPGGQKVKLVFIEDSAPNFDISSPFYQDQLKKKLSINVYKNGHWGTYRHLLLDDHNRTEAEHCFLNSLSRGDLSSLKWLEGSIRPSNTSSFLMSPDETLVKVYYAALNFRDVMTATGKINVDTITRDRREQECVQGFEYSGYLNDFSGKRVMGMVTHGACGSYAKADKFLFWEVPENWSLLEAATVPVVYSTAMYALVMQARIRPGHTVLIHSGTGGVGQAAINIALRNGCIVYATVGTAEKREFLKQLYPALTDAHIFNSRDTSFEKGVMKATNGHGVDVVLNSLAEEKLLASVRCLAKGGTFLEIGKFDMGNNNQLRLRLLKNGSSFYGIMLDMFIKEQPSFRYEIQKLLGQYLKANWIKPLNFIVFQMDQAEEAFRYMGTGKHTGKVLIEIRKEDVEPISLYRCIPRYYCDLTKSYIICGGLGGFGLELADWLILRGCKRLILTSRSGIKTGYQAYRISIWETYGCIIQICTDDITTEAGCLSLIKKANELGPVDAIFNLAVVLQDSLLGSQTEEMFKISFGPKAVAARHLDKLSREYCPRLRYFVLFSSVSCGRGNAGQTNYGMANSIMEKICEKRRMEGLPGLAIQWGAVGEVGLVADMQEESIEMEIGGTLQQRISHCLEVMDLFLKQTESAVVSSVVVAEKRSGTTADNIVSAVANILGIKDLKTISFQATLAEVGMDSMTAVEIKQTLEREFEVFLTPQDIKSMTFARLQEIQDEIDSSNSGVKEECALSGLEMILRHISESEEIPMVSLQGQVSDRSKSGNIILFGGIDGLISVLQPLYKNLEGELVGLQFCDFNQMDTIEDMAENYFKVSEFVQIIIFSSISWLLSMELYMILRYIYIHVSFNRMFKSMST